MDDTSNDVMSVLGAALADRYEFERELGHGGMATVFLARDLKLRRAVAIKVLKPEVAAALGPTRFLREIEIASRLTHPHLLSLHDSGDAAGYLYYVMPYVDGESLRDRLCRERQLPMDDAMRITCDVAEGLSYAHRHGVIHRDIKPENILLQSDRAIVVDFGIARAVSVSSTDSTTSSGIIFGTALYMSPEQGFGERELDARSDVYSLGCVLYEMLAGEPPFGGPNPQTIRARHAGERLPSLRLARPNVPEAVEKVIAKAMAKAPADRFASADAFAESLRASVDMTVPRRRVLVRRRGLALAGVVGVLAIGIAVAAKLAFRGALRQNDWMLVADFEGPADDPQLGDVVRDLVTKGFEQSRFVGVLDRRQLNEVMHRAGVPETTHVDAERARELAVRSSVRAVLRGEVRRLNQTASEVVLHVVRADDGGVLASALGTATSATLPDTVQSLVHQIRERLGERRSEITANRPLRDVTTPSFAAFRKYSAAIDLAVGRSDYRRSNSLLFDAIALDSNFASAWAALGSNFLSTRQIDSARLAFGKALALPSRLSVAEGYRLKADAAYTFEHDVAGAVKWYDLYLAEVPTSIAGRNNRAFFLSALGQNEKALADFRDARALNPFGAALGQPILLNLAATLVVLGRNAEARAVADSLTDLPGQYIRLMLANAEGRWTAIDSLSAGADSPTVASLFRINAITSRAAARAALGAAGAADSILAAATAATGGSEARWYERARLTLAVASGAGVKPMAGLVSADTTLGGGMLRGLRAAIAGDTASARIALAGLRQLSPRQKAIVGIGPALIESWIAARSGQWRRVVDLLGPAALAGEQDPTSLDRPDGFLPRWLVAGAYERLGRPDSAAAYLTLILGPTHMPPLHYPLRGLSFRFANDRLATLRGGSSVSNILRGQP